MSARRRLLVATAALAIPLSSASGATSTAEFLRCAPIAASDARLACYDAAAKAAASAPASGARAESAPPAPAAADPVKAFGLTPAQQHLAPEGPEAIHARIAALSADALGHAIVVLDNGQTWSVSDADSRLGVGDEVTIKRASLGSFTMTTASRHAYKVHRTK